MSDDRTTPTEPSQEPTEQKASKPPPYQPDYDAIAYMEGGQGPRGGRRRIFRRDPGAEARPQARKQNAKKR